MDLAKFSVITFKSKKVTATASNSFTVLGDLTIHGVTKEVDLKVEDWRKKRKICGATCGAPSLRPASIAKILG